MSAIARELRIVVVGAGIAGITTLHTLRQLGYSDVTVLEKGSDVGGVWHWNRYPGLTCDVPSQLYQFAFAPKPDWSHIWAGGPEIQRYHRQVVDKLGLARHIRLNTEVAAAQWNEDSATWTLSTASGETIIADVVICATGVLHHPSTPDIPGLNGFAGQVVHTARWPEVLNPKDRRVAVIGTGSTGGQVVSALAGDAASIAHYVRSPQWILWAPMSLRQTKSVSAALRRFPTALHGLHRILLWGSGILADITTRPSWRRRAVQAYARLSLHAQVRDPALRAKLTPTDEPLCKRQVVSGTYYRAIQSANAELVTEKIAEVTPAGIRTADGTERNADIIVLATGFEAHNYMRPMQIVGREGRTLDKEWASGPRAYRMTAIPGFPNMFMVLGPNSPTGSISLQFTSEMTARYIAQWLNVLRDGSVTSVEVTEEATAGFNDDVARAMPPTVWNTGCNSWYFSESGTIDLFPFSRSTLSSMLQTIDRRDFHLR